MVPNQSWPSFMWRQNRRVQGRPFGCMILLSAWIVTSWGRIANCSPALNLSRAFTEIRSVVLLLSFLLKQSEMCLSVFYTTVPLRVQSETHSHSYNTLLNEWVNTSAHTSIARTAAPPVQLWQPLRHYTTHTLEAGLNQMCMCCFWTCRC